MLKCNARCGYCTFLFPIMIHKDKADELRNRFRGFSTLIV